MLLELFLTLGALCSVLTLFLNATLVTSIFDAWIPLALWIAYSIGFFVLYVLGFVLLSVFVNKSKPQNKPNRLYLSQHGQHGHKIVVGQVVGNQQEIAILGNQIFASDTDLHAC